ncbi:NADH dehydrogenase subunit L [Stackebrandtia albiflava]|uniref:NADH dehydrogenase subunit L n=1 Tax=Stackebrandtia albiflava TaxID=406432 RepID=A0A562UXZ2_9ACTN|nr:NADH-quinone oxidoreductase subunit L [Stackebrandtia albiflava]TWJ10438.1 NADH dehydrogenase subunit L [Stackebrandtia albiflava]
MSASIWLLPLAPAACALAGLLVPPSGRRPAAAIAVTGTAIAFVTAVALAFGGGTYHFATRLAGFGDITVHAAVTVTPVAAYVAVAVATVALLVQVYSYAYLRDDDRYVPYAAQVALFTAAMLLVVVSDDLVLLLIGWELMGACSYLLIGHDRRLPEAPAAAVKAFLVTRVGDVGLLLGIALLGFHTGSFRIPEVLAALPDMTPGTVTAAALLVLAGAAGKSAQFPLHSWLPDAMAGPTPVSALIHAATMVAAGAFLLFRLLPLYTGAAAVVVALVAAVTMIGAALAALASDDLKRVLAWSTVSQVAFMFGGIAVAAGDAAVFHLLSHAAFKALLFLAAGAVIHVAGGNSLAAMGGLRHGAPVLFTTMTLGFAALAGIPPLSGFWSKESILGAAAGAGGLTGNLVLWAGIVTVALTAAYATRAWLLVFLGAPRGSTGHDPEPLMRWPLLILAVPTVLLGVAAFAGPVSGEPPHLWPTLPVLAATALGAAAVYLWWRREPATDPATRLGAARPLFAAGFGFDTLQRALVVIPVTLLGRFASWADVTIVDGAVDGSGHVTSATARRIAGWHLAGLPRHLWFTAAGAVLLAAVGTAAYLGMWA